jgi:hypothetical protein
MPDLWIIACKEINGNIYLTRLPKAIDAHTPGIPDNWYFVGPGSRPSVQKYSGTQFVITFDYLSHLFTRIVDIASWPPTQVDPVQVSGGPNPPSLITYGIQLAQDSLSLKTESSTLLSLTQAFFNPPILAQPTVFYDPGTDTWSATITTVPGWVPVVPANVTPYYRLYRRTYTPSVGPWTLVMDWSAALSYVDSNTGSLDFQYSATWGSQFDPAAPFDPSRHAEGTVGQYVITVTSAGFPIHYQLFLNESLTLDRTSTSASGFGETRELFDFEFVADAIELSKSSIGNDRSSFAYMGIRQAFLHESAEEDVVAYDRSNAYLNSNALKASMG